MGADAAPAPVPVGGLRAIAAGALAIAARGDRGVLGVVVETAGSTYRKPGALILLDAGGVRAGALSGGCLEADLEAHAGAVLAAGLAGEARFDTGGDEDRVFGSATGCGGSSHVLLLPLPAAASPLRDALLAADACGDALALALDTAPDRLGAGTARVGDGPDARRYRFDRAGAAVAGGAPLQAPVEVGVRAPAHLLLLGAGPETRPLLLLTRLLGWRVELLEHRARWLRFAHGCGVDRVHDAGIAALPGLVAPARFDAALVMNHNYDLDARCLACLARNGPAYIGLLGPRARCDELLGELGSEVARLLHARLHAPVGLPLGGDGAEAIALAIVAQLQQHFLRDARG